MSQPDETAYQVGRQDIGKVYWLTRRNTPSIHSIYQSIQDQYDRAVSYSMFTLHVMFLIISADSEATFNFTMYFAEVKRLRILLLHDFFTQLYQLIQTVSECVGCSRLLI